MEERTGVRKFEDLIAWQKARALTREVYRATSSGAFAKDFSLRDQIRRASVSIMCNIAEGFERGGSKEFHQFRSIAKGSCAELRSQLYVAKDVEHLNSDTFHDLFAKAQEAARVTGGLRVAVQRQSKRARLP